MNKALIEEMCAPLEKPVNEAIGAGASLAIGLTGKSDDAHKELLDTIKRIKTQDQKDKALKMLRNLELGAEKTWLNPARFTWALKPAFIFWYPLARVIRAIKAKDIAEYRAELKKIRAKVEAVKVPKE